MSNENKRLLEAILFAASAPLSPQEMYERLPDGVDVGALLAELKADYDGRGVNLVEIDRSWAFRTAVDLADDLSIEKTVAKKMSKAALETLAIIAYHQPITRAEIENIRGVATNKGTLDVLIEASWIKPGRRRETPGRPLTWITSTAFLDQFGLTSVMDLPGLDDLKASGLLDRRPAIDTLPESKDLFADVSNDDMEEDDYDELEEMEG